MRVAYVMSRFPKVTETFVLNEILALRRRGFTVDVHPLLRHQESVSQPEAEALAAEARYRPFLSPSIVAANLAWLLGRPRRYLGAWAAALRSTRRSRRFLLGALGILPKTVQAAREMERDGVEHVHACFANHPALAALVIHRLTGIPYSFTAHGSDLHRDQSGLARKLDEAAFALTVSGANRTFAAERVGASAERFEVLRCGIEAARFPAVERRPGAELSILCVAALRAVKGHRVLIAACAELERRGLPFRCRLIGDGPLREELGRLVAAAGLEGRVELAGARPSQEVAAAMAAADVLVLASVQDREGRREGIPVTLMEALSTGLPVVASRISGIPELVRDGETGLLFPPGDAVALADALERLAHDPGLRQRLGASGHEHVRREFALEARIERLTALFQANGRPAVA